MAKLILSRKGFDSAAGGVPSPMVDGRLVSLPIPASGRSETTFGDLGLGDLVEAQTRGKIARGALCHADPAFHEGRCGFGQTGAAQSHLQKQGVGVGDTFLFFGLFANPETGRREHWIYGTLTIGEIVLLGPRPAPARFGLPYRHPHTLGEWSANNCVYIGEGGTACVADLRLRLTAEDGPLTRWRVPGWMKACGLSYHGRADRWTEDGFLRSVSRGQEFVCDVSGCAEAQDWLTTVIGVIRR